jgi:alpha-ribazole phosphatase
VPAGTALTLQAAEAGAALLPPGLPVWVSGLGRAQQLALELGSLRPDLAEPVIDTRLNEMDFGHWELQRWDAIPRAAFDPWMADFAHHRFGGAESTQQLIDRVADALDDLRTRAFSEAVWVTHAGVIRAAQFVTLHGRGPIRDASQWPKEAPATGGHLCLHL